jgi:hypothetical protein
MQPGTRHGGECVVARNFQKYNRPNETFKIITRQILISYSTSANCCQIEVSGIGEFLSVLNEAPFLIMTTYDDRRYTSIRSRPR